MEHHVGIDVSLQLSSLCVLNADGKVVREAKCHAAAYCDI